MTQTSELRLAALLQLLREDTGPQRGKKTRFAARIGKSTAQVSQWLSGYRTIDDSTAREIEARTRKPRWWMDQPLDGRVAASEPPPVPYVVESLADIVASMSAARWRSVRAQLDTLVGSPEMRDEVLTELRVLLSAESQKRRA